MIQYILQPEDTIASIASKFNTSVSSILKLNDIENIDNIKPGQLLFIVKPNIRKAITNNNMPVLVRGSINPFVHLLQSRLYNAGFLTKKDLNGIFDITTENALIKFSKIYNLKPVNVVNETTWRILENINSYNTADFQCTCRIENSGILMFMKIPKMNYNPYEDINVKFIEVNTSENEKILDYKTSQILGLSLYDCSGNIIWDIADENIFNQNFNSIKISKDQCISYSYNIPISADILPGSYHILANDESVNLSKCKLHTTICIAKQK